MLSAKKISMLQWRWCLSPS